VEALRLAEEHPGFDLLLTDLVMPHISGDELARRLREAEPDLKVLYLTGFCDRLFKDRISLWESETYLDKPCSIKGLLQAVSMSLYGRLAPAPPSIPQRFFKRRQPSGGTDSRSE
jgi:two-component system cell cycle sensor histidine kinase/response regulator CckA